MFNTRLLILASVALLAAFSASAPAGKEMQWIHGHWVRSLSSCKKVEHVEKFNDDDDVYKNAPTVHPFVYERFGIGYFNLARVKMNHHFGDNMIPAEQDDDEHGVAAIGALTTPNGQAINNTVAYFAIRPGSNVHAFKVKQIDFFCLRNQQPEHCALGFRYSPATYETNQTMKWHRLATNGSRVRYAASWGSPAMSVYLKNTGPLQAFSFGLPLNKIDTWKSSTSTVDKLNGELNREGVTAYVDKVTFIAWECEDDLPPGPLGGAMKRVLAGKGEITL